MFNMFNMFLCIEEIKYDKSVFNVHLYFSMHSCFVLCFIIGMYITLFIQSETEKTVASV